MRIALVVLCAAACGSKKNAAEGQGITLRPGTGQVIPDNAKLVGVDMKGTLVDYGAPTSALKVANDRLTGLPASKAVDFNAPEWKAAPLVVVVVDANAGANDVRPALAALDDKCTGFAVSMRNQLAALKTTPCPANPAPPKDAEHVVLALTVAPKAVLMTLSRVNESESVAPADLATKLAAQKKSAFFEGEGCVDVKAVAAAEKKDEEREDGAGAAMSAGLSEMMKGKCDVLVAADDGASVGNVIDVFGVAIASGFTAPRWVGKDTLPPIGPKAPPSEPDLADSDPDVQKAKKRVDELRAAVLAAAKDTSKSTADIVKLTEEQKVAEQALKDAKKKARGK